MTKVVGKTIIQFLSLFLWHACVQHSIFMSVAMSPKQKILVCEDVWKEKFGEVQFKLYALPSLFVELGDNNE